MLKHLFLTILDISFSTSLLILAALLLSPLIQRRYAARWKYRLWIILGLRLVVPVNGTQVYEAVRNIIQRPEAQIVRREETEKEAGKETGKEGIPRFQVRVSLPPQMTASVLPRRQNAQPQFRFMDLTVLDLAAAVWLTGCICVLGFHLYSYRCYKRRLRSLGTVITDRQVLGTLAELSAALNIKCGLTPVLYEEAASPQVTGFLHPVLVLPEAGYDQKELRFILKHELVHLKSRDVHVKMLFVLARAVHWFHPLVWLMAKEAAVDMELACDERVVRHMDAAGRRAYSETLLSTLGSKFVKNTSLSTQFYGGKQIMKKRFKNIMVPGNVKSGMLLLVGACVLTIGAGSLVGCSLSESQGESAAVTNDAVRPIAALRIREQERSQKKQADQKQADQKEADQKEADKKETGLYKTLTVTLEGIEEEMKAILYTGSGYSVYVPEDWKLVEPDTWQYVHNRQVRFQTVCYGGKSLKQVKKLLAADGYRQNGGQMYRQEGDMIHHVKFTECKEGVWAVFYSYPEEAQEGAGRRLEVITDTFAVSDLVTMLAYITDFDNGSLSFDEVEWVTVPGKRAGELGITEEYEDSGFYVYNGSTDIKQAAVSKDCSYTLLDRKDSFKPVEVTQEQFASALQEQENVRIPYHLWIQGQEIFKIHEQYLP